jgi:hypothetical protein
MDVGPRRIFLQLVFGRGNVERVTEEGSVLFVPRDLDRPPDVGEGAASAGNLRHGHG